MSLTFSSTGAGGGRYLLWKGSHVEHWDEVKGHNSEKDSGDRQELIERCRHIERLGLVPRSSTVVWNWAWFAEMPHGSIYRELLGMVPGFYQHENGSIVACGKKAILHKTDGTCEVLELEREEYSGGWYHVMARNGYAMAKMGQTDSCGPCYATYDQISRWLMNHKVTRGSVEAIRKLAA